MLVAPGVARHLPAASKLAQEPASSLTHPVGAVTSSRRRALLHVVEAGTDRAIAGRGMFSQWWGAHEPLVLALVVVFRHRPRRTGIAAHGSRRAREKVCAWGNGFIVTASTELAVVNSVFCAE